VPPAPDFAERFSAFAPAYRYRLPCVALSSRRTAPAFANSSDRPCPQWVKGGSRTGLRVRPNFSNKQTFARQSGTSEKCQYETFAVPSN
jgi:hypothetical protein